MEPWCWCWFWWRWWWWYHGNHNNGGSWDWGSWCVMLLSILIGLTSVSHGLACPAVTVKEMLMLMRFCISGKGKRRDIECNNNSEYILSYSSTVCVLVSIYLSPFLDARKGWIFSLIAWSNSLILLIIQILYYLFSSSYSVILYPLHPLYLHPFSLVFQHLSSNFTLL